MTGWIALGIALVLNAAANAFLKAGSSVFAGGFSAATLTQAVTNPYLISGVVLFALNVIGYSYALSRLPLSLAYPTMIIGGLLIVTAASILIFGESLSYLQAAGLALIIFGLVLLYV